MENQPKSYKNGISENQLKSQNTESWISRNPLRQNDGKSPEILKDAAITIKPPILGQELGKEKKGTDL